MCQKEKKETCSLEPDETFEFCANRCRTDKLEEYTVKSEEISWIVHKGSESILPLHPVNWLSLGLFGLEPLHSLIAVNTNEHLICSVLYLEWWGGHTAVLRLSQTVFQNNTYAQPFFFFFLHFSNPTYSMSNPFPLFGNCSYGLQFRATSLVHNCKERGASWQWLTDCSVVFTLRGLSLPSRTFFSALCLIMLPCYQSSQSDQFVIYVYHRPFLWLCGGRCQWLC